MTECGLFKHLTGDEFCSVVEFTVIGPKGGASAIIIPVDHSLPWDDPLRIAQPIPIGEFVRCIEGTRSVIEYPTVFLRRITSESEHSDLAVTKICQRC